MTANPNEDTVEKITSQLSEGVYQSYLISSTGLEPQVISKICDGLEIKGLIYRKELRRDEGRTFIIKPVRDGDIPNIRELVSRYLTLEG
jgi:hypothetical protein